MTRPSRREQWQRGYTRVYTGDWRFTCGCSAPRARPGRVLDPFCGAATTGLACLKNGRDFTGLELKPEYAQLAIGRVQRIYPLLAAGAEISAGAIPDALGAGPDWNRDLQVMSLAR